MGSAAGQLQAGALPWGCPLGQVSHPSEPVVAHLWLEFSIASISSSTELHCLHDNVSLFRSLKHWINQKLGLFFFPFSLS